MCKKLQTWNTGLTQIWKNLPTSYMNSPTVFVSARIFDSEIKNDKP